MSKGSLNLNPGLRVCENVNILCYGLGYMVDPQVYAKTVLDILMPLYMVL